MRSVRKNKPGAWRRGIQKNAVLPLQDGDFASTSLIGFWENGV